MEKTVTLHRAINIAVSVTPAGRFISHLIWEIVWAYVAFQRKYYTPSSLSGHEANHRLKDGWRNICPHPGVQAPIRPLDISLMRIAQEKGERTPGERQLR
jgi:hypothetical protein